MPDLTVVPAEPVELAYGWSFLVARGRRLGYRPVLAPDFVVQRGLQHVLWESAGGDPDGGVQRFELDLPGVGPLTLVYEIEQPEARELDGDALDVHGRPLEILYGIVSRHRLAGRLDAGDLRAARREALDNYRRFLAGEDGFDVASSRRFRLHGITAVPEPVRALDPPRELPLPSPPARTALLARGTVALALPLAALVTVVLATAT
jgi:hypothetical protein